MSAAVATEITMLERRSKVVDLARTGKSYRRIAEDLGISSPSVVARDIAAWAAETRPSSEVTEELRKLQREEIMALRERLWARMEDPDVQLAVTDRLVKLQEREARLMGLDLQQGISVTILTREGLARAMDWDPLAIEGTAEEEATDGA